MANAPEVKSPQQVEALLGTPGGEQAACDAISALAKDGRFGDLATLARALESGVDRADKQAVETYEVVVDHLEDQVALSTADGAVDALCTLALAPRERSVVMPRSRDVRARAFASRLGYGQSTEALLSALGQYAGKVEYRELLACWMHEVILRGSSLANEPRSKALREALVQARHPLGDLPLELLPAEREVPSYMPLYGDRGLGRAIDALTSGALSIPSIPPPGDTTPVEASLVEDEATTRRMATAVGPWIEGKNGKLEAKLFSLSRQIAPSGLGRTFLRALPLESVRGSSLIDVSRTASDGAFGPLFSAASNGGAYSSGLGGAYGRLAAWTSIGALVGAPQGADVKAIDALASRSAFLVYRAEGPWFYDVAWDLGVLALRPDGRSLAALAATDVE